MLRKIIVVFTVCLLLAGISAPDGAAGKNPVVMMETSLGALKLELHPDKAPITVKKAMPCSAG